MLVYTRQCMFNSVYKIILCWRKILYPEDNIFILILYLPRASPLGDKTPSYILQSCYMQDLQDGEMLIFDIEVHLFVGDIIIDKYHPHLLIPPRTSHI